MSCINPITNVPYIIGDDGPGGGIIFSIPQQGNNNTNYYFEVARHDVSITQRDQVCTFSVCGGDCRSDTNAIPGAEFGVYKETILPSDNGTKIGDGLNNTIVLNSYPVTGLATPNPTNPVIDFHDLAAKLCVDYIDPSGAKDWFLPSLDEARELALNLGPPSQMGNVANLNTSSSNPASEFYWTSSVLKPGQDGLAVGVNATAGGALIMDRCSTGSVRPVRMFECQTTTTSPCSGISCVDYNFRDGNGGLVPGCLVSCSDLGYGTPTNNQTYGYDPTTVYSGGGDPTPAPGTGSPAGAAGVQQNPLCSDSVIGSQRMWFWISEKDVKGQVISKSDWEDDSLGYTITVWDADFDFLGKWHYDNVIDVSNTSPHILTGMGKRLVRFDTPTHLDGLYPVIDYGRKTCCNCSSATGAYFKIEIAATINNPSYVFENAVNNTWIGNIDSSNYSNFCMFEMPYICMYSPGFGQNHCFPWYATYDPPNCCIVYPHKTGYPPTYPNSCETSAPYGTPCNEGGSSLNGGNQAKLSQNRAMEINRLLEADAISGNIATLQQSTVKGVYSKNENQTVELVYDDITVSSKEENENQIISTFTNSLIEDSTKNIFNITFKTNNGYYYSKSPSLSMNFPGSENYKIKVESESKNANGYVIEKTFNISYKNTGFDVLEEDGHNIIFTNKIAKEVDISTEIKEITALHIDKSSIDSNGESRNMSVVGTPGSTFSLTIKDKNGRNILPYSSKITKTVKTIASASATLELNNAAGLEIGMVVLNDQRRGVKITSISNPVKTNVDAINETSTTIITISSHLTFAVDGSITFAKETDITEVAIPDSGVYSFVQRFPSLEKFKRTLKTVASSTVSLTLDYNDGLEKDMKITGTGVDGYDPKIKGTDLDVDTDGVTIIVNELQTIADETELTFETPDNRYDITLYPLMAILGNDVPRYSSKDNDTLPTCSIYQYIDPIVQISPYSVLSNVTTTGTITLTGKANKSAVGTNGDITINMTATKSDGTLVKSREPRFSSVDSESSDFSNTLNTVTKTVREGDLNNKNIVHLNNVAGIRVGMIVTGGNINEQYSGNSTGNSLKVIVKSITGTAVELSSKQTIQKDDILTFSSMFNMRITGLTATLSDNGGLSNGICTVAGTGKFTTFGIDSFTSTFNFDNFLSV